MLRGHFRFSVVNRFMIVCNEMILSSTYHLSSLCALSHFSDTVGEQQVDILSPHSTALHIQLCSCSVFKGQHMLSHTVEHVCVVPFGGDLFPPKLRSGLSLSHSIGSHSESSHTDSSLTSALWRDADDVKAWECIEPNGGWLYNQPVMAAHVGWFWYFWIT